MSSSEGKAKEDVIGPGYAVHEKERGDTQRRREQRMSSVMRAQGVEAVSGGGSTMMKPRLPAADAVVLVARWYAQKEKPAGPGGGSRLAGRTSHELGARGETHI